MTGTGSPWRRAVVTGATSGIGAAITDRLLADGVAVVAVGRDLARLEALASAHPDLVEVLAADLGTAEGRSTVVSRIEAETDPVDLVVNNAGFGHVGPFWEIDRSAEAAVIDVNVVALFELTHAAAGVFVARGGGAILNVSSVAAHMVAPDGATYAATKAFVTSLGESLATELPPHGVTITTVEPGLTRTDFHARAAVDYSDVPNALWSTATEVADAALAGAAKGTPVVVPGVHNKAGRVLFGNTPGWFRRKAAVLTSQRGD